MADRDADAAKAVAAATGGVAHVVDLADAEAMELPRAVDILVNNAGLQHVAPIEDFPPDRFELIQKVMLTAPFLLMRHCLPHMYAGGWGRLVNVSSMHGLRPPLQVRLRRRQARSGGAEQGGRPGGRPARGDQQLRQPRLRTDTSGRGPDRGPGRRARHPRDEVVADVLLDRSAIERLIEPEEVAAVCVWLCGPHTSYITGSSLPVDGGWGAR
ncbi:3-hydroxybutyrate dehydrogenase OS=Streptomyces microflavus OX=1919 GN=HUT09_25410 PE=3 SV=1 [Streptomyces microflavus]